MPVSIYNDYSGRRVIIRNVGPPGIGIPDGGDDGQILVKDGADPYITRWAVAPDGTDAVSGPASSVDGNFVLFDGTSGKLIKDSTRAISYFATKSYADTKVDIDGDKVLSDNNFTDIDKAKLDNLSTGGFRGVYTLEADIDDISEPVAGDRAYLEVSAETVVEYLYDSTNEVWTPQTLDAVNMTGAEIAAVLFDPGEVWTQSDCLIFTPAYKATIDNNAAAIEAALGGGSGFQPLDATLTALSGLVNAADKLPYFTGLDTMAVVTFTSPGRAVVSAATVADQRTALGIGTTDTPQVAGLKITSGSTARGGDVTLVAGTVTINNTAVTANTKVIHSLRTAGGTMGTVSYVINAGVSIVFTSSNVLDTSTLSYFWFDVI